MEGRRRILHVDMDAYFASVEVRADPSLRGKPVIVGALPGNRGVVASASYEAREFGIRAGMPIGHARRLCPAAHFLPCHPKLYVETSRRILSRLLTYTPNVEMFSIDEAFIDVSDMLDGAAGEEDATRKAEAIARDIAGSLEAEIGLSCSIGIGPNKLIAKMASDLEKPRGITALSEESFRYMFWPRPVDELYGVGEKTAAALMIFGIETIRDLAETSVSLLKGRFGVYGEALHSMAWGHDDSPVVPAHETPPAKSLGHEHTLPEDLTDPDEALGVLMWLAEKVGEDLRAEGYAGRCVVLKLRHSDFSTITRQRMLEAPTDETSDIYRVAKDLFRTNYCGGGLRLLGVTMADLVKVEGRRQLDLFPEEERKRRLTQTLDRIREEFGSEIIVPAEVLEAKRSREEAAMKPTRARSRLIHAEQERLRRAGEEADRR